MSVKLNDDFFSDLKKIAMERPFEMIPNTAKVVHNTPCNIRSRKNSSSERENKVCTLGGVKTACKDPSFAQSLVIFANETWQLPEWPF